MDVLLPWLAVLISVLIIIGYELARMRAAGRDPTATARSAHLELRAQWVRALSRQAGTEILGVQALRNSLMSATINASTAALTLMGSISLIAARGGFAEPFSVRLVLEAGLLLTLFATYVCAALSMRYYHHAGFAISLPVSSPERESHIHFAITYVQRGGLFYSWSLHFFLSAAPIVVGILNPLVMPAAALGLLVVLSLFDRAPRPVEV